MTNSEIALQLTLKMIDKGLLRIDDNSSTKESAIINANQFNSKQITDFYNYVFENVKW